MLRLVRHRVLCALSVLLLLLAHGGAGFAETVGPTLDVSNGTGVVRLFSSVGPVDVTHPFAQSLGSNGRACVTCHSPLDGMTITPAGARARFDQSDGLDPLFRTNDGSHSPTADAPTPADRG